MEMTNVTRDSETLEDLLVVISYVNGRNQECNVEQKLMMPTLVVSDFQDAKPIPLDFLVQEKRYVSILDSRSRVKFVSTKKIKYPDATQGEYVKSDLNFIILPSSSITFSSSCLSLLMLIYLLILLYLCSSYFLSPHLTFSLRLLSLMYLFISSPSHFKLSYSLFVSPSLVFSLHFLLFPQIKT